MPLFVISFLLVLVLDLGLIGYLLTVQDEVTFMMIVLLLIMGVPLVGQLAAPNVVQWKKSQLFLSDPSSAPWSSVLAPLTSASSLTYLLFTSLLSLAPKDPGQNWLVLALWVYLIIQVVRMQNGMLANILISLYVLIKPARPSERVYAVAGLLGALAGLSLVATFTADWVRLWLHRASPDDPAGLSQFLAILLVVWISFAYSLMWGGAVLWFTGKSRQGGPEA